MKSESVKALAERVLRGDLSGSSNDVETALATAVLDLLMENERLREDAIDAEDKWYGLYCALQAENERLRAAIKWYLEQYPCGGVGSGIGICSSIDNRPGRYCVEDSDNPEEWCASGRLLAALENTDD